MLCAAVAPVARAWCGWWGGCASVRCLRAAAMPACVYQHPVVGVILAGTCLGSSSACMHVAHLSKQLQPQLSSYLLMYCPRSLFDPVSTDVPHVRDREAGRAGEWVTTYLPTVCWRRLLTCVGGMMLRSWVSRGGVRLDSCTCCHCCHWWACDCSCQAQTVAVCGTGPASWGFSRHHSA